MTLDRDRLQAMIDEDEFGLLAVRPKSAPVTPDDRLVSAFGEIVEFVKVNGRLPERTISDMKEAQLAMRLKGINENDRQRELLKPIDELNLIKDPEPPASIAEAIDDDPLGLLGKPELDIFTLEHVPKAQTMPEQIARRKPCEDFELFKSLFEQCHADLRSGQRKLLSFKNPSQIEPGRFFVLNGLLVYVAEVGELALDAVGKANGRTRCIFENGTESDLLLQSLASNLYKDGRRVTEHTARILERVELAPHTSMGSVYVLRSLSEDDQVRAIDNMHKIGSTGRTADERIIDAPRHATFLNAPVELVAEYRLPAAATIGVESILHKFFAAVRLDIWFERDGVTVADANEWFDVPLPIIDDAITLIENETITSFRYVPETRSIELSSGPNAQSEEMK